jgi:hypothetical protein
MNRSIFLLGIDQRHRSSVYTDLCLSEFVRGYVPRLNPEAGSELYRPRTFAFLSRSRRWNWIWHGVDIAGDIVRSMPLFKVLLFAKVEHLL